MPVSQQATEQVDAADDTVEDISDRQLWSFPLPNTARRAGSGHALAYANTSVDAIALLIMLRSLEP